MGLFFVYILKASVCLVGFYLFYRLLLSQETFHRFNRIALLGVLVLSELVPFVEGTMQWFSSFNQSLLELEEKGYVGHEGFGRTYQYYALVSREDFKKKTLRGVISKYFNNSYLGVVSSLVREEEISLDELKELIREVEKGNQ